MSMDLGNTGVTWNNKDPKWIKFNSEVAVRKGEDGWVINSRVDNWTHDTTTDFDYILTTYKYRSGKWEKEENPKLWQDPVAATAESDPYSQILNDRVANSVNIYKKRPVIKVPGGSWFSGDDWIHPNVASSAKNRIPKETKNWSGVWIDEGEKGNSWIFGDIELYVGEKKYSQVFCKEDSSCRQKYSDGFHLKTRNIGGEDTWTSASKLRPNDNEKAQDMVEGTVKGMIDKLKNSKGYWTKLKDICDAKIGETPSEEQQKQLRMYCSKERTSK